jgi:hypothetical protein
MSRTSSSGGTATSVYNAIPSKLPGNVPSRGFQATQTYEFGDEVGLGGPARNLASMTVVLSSWACESGHWTRVGGDCLTNPGATFSHPLTFTIYEDDSGSPGDVLAQRTENVDIPYRPSADDRCGDGRWYSRKDQKCYNGFATKVTMPLAALDPLPDQVIWSIAFQTSSSGYLPVDPGCFTSAGCPYDSLNVGSWSAPNAPYQGTDIDVYEAFVNGFMVGAPVFDPEHDGDERPLGQIKATR